MREREREGERINHKLYVNRKVRKRSVWDRMEKGETYTQKALSPSIHSTLSLSEVNEKGNKVKGILWPLHYSLGTCVCGEKIKDLLRFKKYMYR